MNKDRMTPQEIVKADAKKHGGDFEQSYTDIARLVDAGRLRILRHDNNLFLFPVGQSKTADGYWMSGDGKNIQRSVRDFILSLQKAGFVTATVTVPSKEEASVLNQMGFTFLSRDKEGQIKFSLFGGAK